MENWSRCSHFNSIGRLHYPSATRVSIWTYSKLLHQHFSFWLDEQHKHMLEDPDICLLLKACKVTKPPGAKLLRATWDPDTVLNYIENMPENNELSIYKLWQKAILLTLWATGRQKCDLLHIPAHPCTKIGFHLEQHIKGYKGPKHAFIQSVTVVHYLKNGKLCSVKTLKAYIECCHNRSLCNNFWVTMTPPYSSSQPNTLQRWAKVLLKEADVDLEEFTPHSTRGVAATRALQQGEPLDTVMEKCAWKKTSTFCNHFCRPATTTTTTKYNTFLKWTRLSSHPKRTPRKKLLQEWKWYWLQS